MIMTSTVLAASTRARRAFSSARAGAVCPCALRGHRCAFMSGPSASERHCQLQRDAGATHPLLSLLPTQIAALDLIRSCALPRSDQPV